MLSPSQFLSLYGLPGVRRIFIPPGFFHIVEYSSERYVFGVLNSNRNITIVPNIEDITPFTTANFTPSSQPFIISHSDVGSLVNMSWRINNTDPINPAFVIILDGRMKHERK